MNGIKYSDYKSYMGKIIDIQEYEDYIENHYSNSVNIPYEKLLSNHKKYLNTYDTFFIRCRKGHLSKKAVQILTLYGYKVYQLL